MKAAIFAFTRRGCDTARRVRTAMEPGNIRMFTMEKFGMPDFEPYAPPLAGFMKPVFGWADIIVFVGSTGMAVRGIAPWVRDKKTDPGVIVVDESGSVVISLLSGHIGGANQITRLLALQLEATPIITTATDVNGRFSVDDWAARNGLTIGSMKNAKAVAAAILEEDVPMTCDFPVAGQLPEGTFAGKCGKLGIYIGYRDCNPFQTTLQLIPKVLTLGIGCRRGTPMEKIEQAVKAVCQEKGIAMEAIGLLASIDLKADEEGLLAFAKKYQLPTRFYTAQELRQVPGEFPASAFVSGVTGVDNVCQRAAMAEAEKCIVEKTAMDAVTVAIGEKHWEAVF